MSDRIKKKLFPELTTFHAFIIIIVTGTGWAIFALFEFDETLLGKLVLGVLTPIAMLAVTPAMKGIFLKEDGSVNFRITINVIVLFLLIGLCFIVPGQLFKLDWVRDKYGLTGNAEQIVIAHQEIIWAETILLFAVLLHWLTWLKNATRAAKNNLFNFIESVGLLGGITGANRKYETNYRIATQQTIANNIKSDCTLRILLINGRTDLVTDNSPIRKRIRSERPKLRVLLLDPFSDFARERAEILGRADGHSPETAHKLYLADFCATTAALKQLQNEGLDVQYRIYCSRPLFRFYHGENEDRTSWCASQHYLMRHHGFAAPQYFYEENTGLEDPNNFSVLAKEAFSFIWERGFASYSPNDIGPALTYYMAQMNGVRLLDDKDQTRDYREVREELINRINAMFDAVK